MLIPLLLLLSLLFKSSFASNPIYFNQCIQDSDCFYMNGVCSIDGRCICSLSNLFNQTNWRCYPPSASSSISYSSPLYYPSQSNYIYLFQTEPGQLPTNWTCTVDMQYCQGNKDLLWWAMFNLSLSNVSWQCTQEAGLRPATLAAVYPNNYSIPLTPNLELGCVNRTVYCGKRGSWNGSHCVCSDGWEGIRCQFPIASSHVIDPVILPQRPCQIGNDSACLLNQRCYWSQQEQTGLCYCKSGYRLLANLIDYGCIPAIVYQYNGAINAQNESLQVNLTWSTATNFSWWIDERGRENQVYNPYPLTPGEIDLAMRFDTSRIWLIQNGSSNSTLPSPEPVCINGSTYSNITGQCECPPAFAYSYNCSYLQWDCSSDLCSSQGYCDQSATGCACFDGYYGDNCNFTSTECSNLRCNGTGQCLTQSQACQCQQWSTGFDCSTVDCVNGGVSINNGTACLCSANYTGSACQWLRCSEFGYWQDGQCYCWSPIHGLSQSGNCTVDLCMNGRLSANGLQCDCNQGYSWNATLSQCAPVCLHNGWQASPTKCQCPDGWTGATCYAIDGLIAVERFVKNDVWSIVYITVSLFIALVIPACLLLYLYRSSLRSVLSYTEQKTVDSVMKKWQDELKVGLLSDYDE